MRYDIFKRPLPRNRLILISHLFGNTGFFISSKFLFLWILLAYIRFSRSSVIVSMLLVLSMYIIHFAPFPFFSNLIFILVIKSVNAAFKISNKTISNSIRSCIKLRRVIYLCVKMSTLYRLRYVLYKLFSRTMHLCFLRFIFLVVLLSSFLSHFR